MSTISTLDENVVMERKKVSISAKRQFTIPQKFFSMLGFASEAECLVRGNELIIRPLKNDNGGEFAEQILADLISQGYSGEALLSEFKKLQKMVKPAIEEMLLDAQKAARGEINTSSYEDVFGADELTEEE